MDPRPLRSLAFAVLCALTLGGPARAQDADKVRTVVVGLEGRRNVDEGLALAMSDVVHGEVIQDRRRAVFGRTDLARVLAFESEKQALGCQDDSCLAEISSAMDADRIITGSIDKVGSSYFVVIAEIDAREVEPLARVQRTLPLDEDKLIAGVQDMTRELLKQTGARTVPKPAAKAAPVAAAPVAAAPAAATTTTPATTDDASDDDDEEPTTGTLEITSAPEGLDVYRDGVVVGKTPYTLESPPATLRLAVKVDAGEPLAFDAPVELGETTSVVVTPDTVEPPPSALAAYEDADGGNSTTTWALVGTGVACCAAGTLGGLLVDGALLAGVGVTYGFTVVGLCCGGCVGGLACGGALVNALFLGPDRPADLDEAVHRVVVTPASGDELVFERAAPFVPASSTEVPPSTDAAPSEGDPAAGEADDGRALRF